MYDIYKMSKIQFVKLLFYRTEYYFTSSIFLTYEKSFFDYTFNELFYIIDTIFLYNFRISKILK